MALSHDQIMETEGGMEGKEVSMCSGVAVEPRVTHSGGGTEGSVP